MKSSVRWIIILICFSTLALITSACQFNAPTAATQTAVATGAPASTAGAYPQPYPQATLEPYLAPSESYPGVESIQVTPLAPGAAGGLYPGIQDGAEAYWDQAVAMILNGEVTQVMQTHDLKVYLTLKDGRTLFSIEPEIDEVMRVIEFCGEPCKNIMVASE
jgi:hypothetical protein